MSMLQCRKAAAYHGGREAAQAAQCAIDVGSMIGGHRLHKVMSQLKRASPDILPSAGVCVLQVLLPACNLSCTGQEDLGRDLRF